MSNQDIQSLDELKQAADVYFGTCYTVCHLRHDEPLVAMLCNVGKPYSPITTWLYVARDEEGRHYITKRRTNAEDVELTKLLTRFGPAGQKSNVNINKKNPIRVNSTNRV